MPKLTASMKTAIMGGGHSLLYIQSCSSIRMSAGVTSVHPPPPPLAHTHSACDTIIPAEGKALVKTDIAVALPEGCYGRVGETVNHIATAELDYFDHIYFMSVHVIFVQLQDLV